VIGKTPGVVAHPAKNKKLPSHTDNLNLIISQISARSDTRSEVAIRPISRPPLQQSMP